MPKQKDFSPPSVLSSHKHNSTKNIFAQLKPTSKAVAKKIEHGLENFFHIQKELPQYKYFARPFYKAIKGYKLPVLGVPATFIATDYLFHQIPVHLRQEFLHRHGDDFSLERALRINVLWSIRYATLSLPIAIAKQWRLHEQQQSSTPLQQNFAQDANNNNEEISRPRLGQR